MVKWYRAIHLFGFTANWPCQNAAFGTRRRLKGNATNTHNPGNRKLKGLLLKPHATTDMCLTQCLRSSSRLCGGGGKEGAEGGRRSLSVRWWKRERTRGREHPGLEIATIRGAKEGNASDTMHACFQIAGCQCSEGVPSAPVALLTGLQGSGFCASVGRTRTLSSVKLVRR